MFLLVQAYPGSSSSSSSIIKKTSQFKMACKDDSGYITQLKSKNQKLSSTSPYSHWAVFVVL